MDKNLKKISYAHISCNTYTRGLTGQKSTRQRRYGQEFACWPGAGNVVPKIGKSDYREARYKRFLFSVPPLLIFSSRIFLSFSRLSRARQLFCSQFAIIAKVERRCDLDSPEEDTSPRARLREFPSAPLSVRGSIEFDTTEQRHVRDVSGCSCVCSIDDKSKKTLHNSREKNLF